MNFDDPRKPTRQGPRYDYARALRESHIRSKAHASTGTRTAYTTQGVFVSADEPEPGTPGESLTIQRFKIQAFSATYISAIKTDGINDDPSEVFRIAIPYDLRDGTQTQSNTNPTRSVTVSGKTGIEEITPAYAVNGQIVAAKITGNTGVIIPIGGVDTELEWEDLNIAGRTWQFPRRVVRVCIDGNTLSMIIRGSEPA